MMKKQLELVLRIPEPIFEEINGMRVDFNKGKSQPESQPESLQNKVLELLSRQKSLSKSDIALKLGQKKISGQLNKVIRILLGREKIALTIPSKPSSRLQKYYIKDRRK
jgi:hypothetical protein